MTICLCGLLNNSLTPGNTLSVSEMRLLCSAAQDFILEIILAAEDLQLLSQSIHRGIFAQFSPAVKSKSCSFQSILPLILDLCG